MNSIYIDDKVKDYIVDIVLRDARPEGLRLDLNGYIQYGASPRATITLTLAARAHAFLQGRGYVTPQDVKDIALRRPAPPRDRHLRGRGGEHHLGKHHRRRSSNAARAVNRKPAANDQRVNSHFVMNFRKQTREILKKVRQIEIRTRRLVDGFAGAANTTRVFKGRGMDFDEVREYVAGRRSAH